MSAPPPYSYKADYQPQPGYQPQPAYQPQPVYQPQPNYGTYQPVPVSTATTVVVAQPTCTAPQVRIIEKKPDNYLCLSVFTLLCCCWVFGLIALIFALQVDSAYFSGNHAGATSAARSARTWSIVGIIWGSVSIGVVVVIMVISISVSVATANSYTYDGQ